MFRKKEINWAEFDKKKKTIFGLFSLINGYFWGTPSGPFVCFAFPIVFMAIMGWLIGYYAVLAGVITMSSMLVTLNLMPQAIYEFKNSCVLKRIGATPIKPLSFILITGIYYFLMMIVSLVWCFVWMIIIFIPYFSTGASWGGDIIAAFDPPSIATIFQTIDWGGFIYSWILTVLVGICMGMVLVSFTKSSLALQTTGLFITIVSMFLAAQALPVSVVRQSDFFWYLGYVVTPFKSVSTMMNESWNVGVSLNNSNASTIFNVNSQFCAYDLLPVAGNGKMHLSEPTLVCDTPEKIINLILPWIWAAILSLIAVKKFKWSTR